jgi:hypothetical protein
MKNINIIISVIIVLCIAAGVTAYGLMSPEDNIFSNLAGYTPDNSENPNGDEGVNDNGDEGLNQSTTDANSNNAKSSGSSNNNANNNNPSGSESHYGMTRDQAKSIATKAIGEPETYAGTPYWDESIKMWVVKIYDNKGEVVDGIGVDPETGFTNRV